MPGKAQGITAARKDEGGFLVAGKGNASYTPQYSTVTFGSSLRDRSQRGDDALPKCMERSLTAVITLCNSETYLWRRGKKGTDISTRILICSLVWDKLYYQSVADKPSNSYHEYLEINFLPHRKKKTPSLL
jgi:hypothetical protein